MSSIAASRSPDPAVEETPAAVRMASAACAFGAADLDAALIDEAKTCLRDLIGCACESRALPWSRQACATIAATPAGASIVGEAGAYAAGDAAFVNAVMGHGLVREDMHAGSISHLGIVVLPTVLALAETRAVAGADFLAAIVVGYELGAQLGRAVMNAEVAKIHRPTGVTGPVAGAAAAAHLLKLDVNAYTSALAFAANASAGFNQWAWTGGSEMFFQAGLAARSAVTAVGLAAAGAYGSPSAIDGAAGLCAALGRAEAGANLRPFAAEPEILRVYHKAVPACNFAQTPALAALRLARTKSIAPARIASILVRVPRAGALYPGCDYAGPYANVLQGKMSIQYNVAAALLTGEITERNFDLLADPGLARLVSATRLEVDPALTAAYPGLQGGEVLVTLADGTQHAVRLEDVVHASAEEVARRFEAAAAKVFGAARAAEIAETIDTLEQRPDAGALARLLRA
ncbi:MAG TPA: MmgE/PrpD family protein [Gammaproteobacteria bacterium]|nr:MmgE/PrpD family protein [Gammaproteobacteria bacterium]